ncbi:hypothetical protein BDY21DRAFT_369923 [Lineolata rhizophorae]|uniref:Uncharacterized protein n=1 Tax=Lineolata rhizophorae TaxID=578093 RepID=A0A6A6P992_9PEZI|nr:hypothetical protein BDY21DRAFT_369923 [Lineolata rhizophorae]
MWNAVHDHRAGAGAHIGGSSSSSNQATTGTSTSGPLALRYQTKLVRRTLGPHAQARAPSTLSRRVSAANAPSRPHPPPQPLQPPGYATTHADLAARRADHAAFAAAHRAAESALDAAAARRAAALARVLRAEARAETRAFAAEAALRAAAARGRGPRAAWAAWRLAVGLGAVHEAAARDRRRGGAAGAGAGWRAWTARGGALAKATAACGALGLGLGLPLAGAGLVALGRLCGALWAALVLAPLRAAVLARPAAGLVVAALAVAAWRRGPRAADALADALAAARRRAVAPGADVPRRAPVERRAGPAHRCVAAVRDAVLVALASQERFRAQRLLRIWAWRVGVLGMAALVLGAAWRYPGVKYPVDGVGMEVARGNGTALWTEAGVRREGVARGWWESSSHVRRGSDNDATDTDGGEGGW